MNINRPRDFEGVETARKPDEPPHRVGTHGRTLLWGSGVIILVMAIVAGGGWKHYAQSREVDAIAQASRDMVPEVRVETVQPSAKINVVSLPATTLAFSDANIFARASGYIAKREVDIGDHVKTGQLLAEIVAPELDHQIAQAEATLVQAQANRELAQVTWDRDRPLVAKGWVTAQQGTIDEQTQKAQEAAVAVA